jgi:hypothetical protein
MTKIDDMIREALEGEDREIFAQTEELGYFALGLNQFRGKLGWVTWVIMLVQGTMFLGGVWCAFGLFQAADALVAVKWGISGAVLMLAATSLKMSLMPQMQADRVIRELKRIELMLAARK